MSVAVVGAGVIGAGWVVQLLSRGQSVRVFDPSVTDLGRKVEEAAEAVTALGGDLTGWEARLSVATTLAEAVEGAGFVQENGPEDPHQKEALLWELDALVPEGVVIASSTSTLPPSRLASMCSKHPERVIVGHPFNPVYLIPLVEVVGAPVTDPDLIDQAMSFYTGVGKKPVRLRAELPGHLANRLQAALWREAYSLVERGAATVADIDAAIAHGPGLRWALLGPLVNQHLSGGAGGLAHVLEHLGPMTQLLMDDLGEPTLTPELADLLVRGVDEELGTRDQVRLAQQRDELLVQLLTAKSRADSLP
ncbi:3-hydroxyacyl-CoA dehydrogenase [Kribbella antiqua]|uniref:3-hydroxyacyl-CoA dehydrogenase n=1 Tax=Kribbella antiqua TaxID=2512217 RepID=A0A4V2S511_9ACTN|nr:3-hydroxyacyl-CoA dehydrogenase NAD-binding domain-containing protein [Kribbella antiqua]TCO50300.1 3-hydroxyacyl-CoA dehydrogenase [Kribbella antiqua]